MVRVVPLIAVCVLGVGLSLSGIALKMSSWSVSKGAVTEAHSGLWNGCLNLTSTTAAFAENGPLHKKGLGACYPLSPMAPGFNSNDKLFGLLVASRLMYAFQSFVSSVGLALSIAMLVMAMNKAWAVVPLVTSSLGM